MPSMIHQGDTTSHGGTVLEGFSSYLIEGRPAAGMGHKVRCPQCQGTFAIAEGNTSHVFSGVPLAHEGMKTTCGAVLLASQSHTMHANIATPAILLPNAMPINALAQQPEERQVQFYIRHAHTREPLEGVPYDIVLSNGAVESGYSDAKGLTKRLMVKKTITARLVVKGNP